MPALVGPVITLSGGPQTTRFEISSDMVLNFAESYIAFQMVVAAAAVGVRNATYADTPAMIQSITIRAKKARVILVQIDDVPTYFKTVTKVMTSMQEYLSLDSSELPVPVGGTRTTPFLRRNKVVGTNPVIADSYILGAAGIQNPNGPLYIHHSIAATAMTINAVIPMRLFAHTILALNKDLSFGDDQLEFSITWSPRNRMGWTFTGDASPIAGLAALTTAVTIDNIFLYVARQMSDRKIMQVQAKTAAGMSFVLPWVRTDAHTLTGAVEEPTFSVNETDGQKLTRVYYSAFDVTGVNNLSVDCDNRGASKITSIRTKVDNVPKEMVDVNVAAGMAYILNRKYLRGSVIDTSVEYHANFVYILDWSQDEDNPLEASVNPLHYNRMVGLDLNKTRTISFNVLVPFATPTLTHRVVVCTQRTALIKTGSPIVIL